MPSTTDVAVATVATDRRRTDTRDRLIDAAQKLFAEKGYAGTTIAEIERAVGLRPGSGGLYRHFSSKDDLLLESVHAYHERVRDLRASLAAARADASARSRRSSAPARRAALTDDLRSFVSTVAEFLLGEGPMVQLSLDTGGLPDVVRHAVGDSWDEGYGMLADVFEHHGVAPGASSVMAVAALGSLNHYFTAIGTWKQRPAGIDAATFIDAWVEQWTAAALA